MKSKDNHTHTPPPPHIPWIVANTSIIVSCCCRGNTEAFTVSVGAQGKVMQPDPEKTVDSSPVDPAFSFVAFPLRSLGEPVRF